MICFGDVSLVFGCFGVCFLWYSVVFNVLAQYWLFVLVVFVVGVVACVVIVVYAVEVVVYVGACVVW